MNVHEFLRGLYAAKIAGERSGIFLAVSHYALKPLGETFPFRHPIFNYIYGSLSCLTALTGALLAAKPKNPLVIAAMAIEIWSISGVFVASTYVLDGVTDEVLVMVLNNGNRKHKNSSHTGTN